METTNPAVFSQFIKGLHVVRRTDKYWAGLGCDLVIEQTLMRTLKSNGGLTRGSGMTDEQRIVWTMSLPVSSLYNLAMQDFTDTTYASSEQHKDIAQSRVKRDASDLEKLSTKLRPCSPFALDPSLRNIFTGVVATKDVNVTRCQELGTRVVQELIGKAAFTCSFKRSLKAKTLVFSSAVKVSGEQIIDPALLFQRLLVVSQSGDISIDAAMKYELCPYPPSLFEARDIMRKADKPQLSDSICKHALSESAHAVLDSVPETDHYVLYGGSLLHRLKWNQGDTYGSIANAHASFTTRTYGAAIIVFDGYDGPSTKDNTYQRRKRNELPRIVDVKAERIFTGKKKTSS